MKKNVYLQAQLQRNNAIKTFLYDVFFKLASYPRMLLEVFIRKNFGVRYFSLATAITIAVLMIAVPLVFGHNLSAEERVIIDNYGLHIRGLDTRPFLVKHGLWYAFVASFLVCVYMRMREVKRGPSPWNFDGFSLYTGDLHPRFLTMRIKGKLQSVRLIETLFEPALFFLAGLILFLLKQKLGIVLMGSAFFYSMSYLAAYKKGDDFVMDKIDEMIMNEELENAFVNDLAPDKTRGVKFYAKKPKDIELRRKLAEDFTTGDEDVATVT